MTLQKKKKDFNKIYANLVYSPTLTKLAKLQVSFIIKKLKLKKGMRILDVGCGNGRHALEFARRGFFVTGVDSSRDLLILAKKEARKEGLSIQFILNEFQNFHEKEKYDLVISIFSFGFLNKKNDHLAFLKNIVNSLKSSGKIVLVTGNSLLKLKEAKKYGEDNRKSGIITRITKRRLPNNDIVEDVEITDTNRMNQTIKTTWQKGRNIYMHKSTMRLFMPHEIKRLMTRNGLRIIDTKSNFNNSRFEVQKSSRIVIFGIKD